MAETADRKYLAIARILHPQGRKGEVAAEILTDLPAGDGVHCATTTFELDGPIRTFPDRNAFQIQLVERLSHLADELAAITRMEGVSPRLGFVAKNMEYVRDRVAAYGMGAP